MYDLTEDNNVETTQAPLKLIRAEGLSFLSKLLDHPDKAVNDNRNKRSIVTARIAAKRYIADASDKGWAFWEVFTAVYGQHLRKDSWSGDLYLDGSLTNPQKLLNDLEEALGMLCKLSTEQFNRKLDGCLEHAQFNPVKRYLERLTPVAPDEWQDWGTLAEILFGTSDHLSQVKLTRWLIGAVARAMNPGCQMDSALVIRGKQGIGKTSLLKDLFGDHFRTLHSHQATLEQQRVSQQAWGLELGELEATFRARDIAALKAFLTETHDSYRDLYNNSMPARPRHCVFAGTTNEAAFLNDSTGSRRFWIIDAGTHQIPVDWVKVNRDRIWAVAYCLWRSDEAHWLSPEEAELSELSNKGYQTENSFEEPLRIALDILEARHDAIAITASDAKRYLLGIKPENHKRHDRELASALESLGYARKKFQSKALNGWFYIKPGVENPVAFNLVMVDEVLTARMHHR